ncbi:Dopey N-inal [Leishmania donovani]|uniref:Dopey_N-inal_putative/Pfam:PF04118 n=1 Tax=Leishmania donovani TaxID=5661 RepID=A0A6J8FJV0_LEIDO|nr:Dopey N-inal [Leishmania donovani]VDZ47734.1 Dopey_N-inal_putative/Pfam:PF04118 [Leishmania donovani]
MSHASDNGEGKAVKSSQPPSLKRSSLPPTRPAAAPMTLVPSVASVSSNGVHVATSGSSQGVASQTDAKTASTTAGAPSDDSDGKPSEVDAAVDHSEHSAVEACSFHSHAAPASQGPSSVQQAYTFSSSLPSPRSPTAAAARAAPVTDQPAMQDIGSSTDVSASDVAKWKENREYKMLERGMHKILSAIDSTLSADWATQASLLGQLLACLRQYKGVIGAVELPDGLHFAKALGRTLSPLSVVGVQRKALEVVQCYLEIANPVYPMTKDLPFVLPGLLELLPQASMQVKGDILKLLDRGVVRRLPGSALRACVQGLLTALLSCLEESETSSIYRGAMGLLEYVQAALARDAPAPSLPSSSQRGEWAELRGGQVLAAHMWVLIRDASALRSPALNVMKVFIAQSGGLASGSAAGPAEGAAEDAAVAASTASTPTSALPDWVGGDAATMASALLNCLQDTQEKTHRLALDVLVTVCPLTSVDCDSANFTHTPLAAFFDGNTNKHTSASVGVSPPPCCGNGAIIPFEVKSLLVAAAVQLLGTRYGTPSVARRIFQWLTVNPGVGGSVNERPGMDDDDSSDADGGEHHRDALNSRASSSCVAYVQDITSCVVSRGFDMVVEHWWTRWVGKVGDDTPAEQAPPYVSAALSALEHSAAQAIRTATAPRLASASSVAAALGAREASSNFIALPDVPVGISVPLVWVRALLVLFRYRSRSTQGGDGALLMSPVAGDAATYEGAEVPIETGCGPFLMHVAPLLLPSLSRLIAGVSSFVGGSSGGVLAGAAAEMWTAELHELLRVLPWGLLVELDTCAVQHVEELLRPVLHPLCASGVEESDEAAAPAAPSVSAHLQAVAATRAQKRIAAQTNNLCTTAKALESVLVDAAAEQPSPAQEYVRASLRWSAKVAQLLSEVLKALEAEMRAAGGATGGATMSNESLVCQSPMVQLLLSTANGLLRLLAQRMQLMEPMLDSVLAAASATGTPSVVTVDFFSAFVSAVDACLLRHIRSATANVTVAALHTPESDASGGGHGTADGAAATAALFCFPEHASDLQELLARMHRITLRFTSFLAQLHLRCQQQAAFGVLLDSSPENSAGSRERDFAEQTTVWLESLCDGAAVAAAAGAHLFFSRAVRLLLDALLRARGCLLPAVVYSTLELVCPTAGGIAEGVAFTNAYLLAPVVRSLWEGCAGGGDEASGAVDMCRTSLLALIAVSPACSRCLDTFLLETPADAAVPRLVGLQRELAALRARQRRGQSRSGSTPLLETLTELQDPGVLFLGLLTTLECLLCVPSGILAHGGVIAEPTRQLARAYVSHAIVRDPLSILLPLHFSFLCPLVTESACNSSTSGESKRRGRMVDAATAASSPPHSTGSPTLSTVPLTVLLPSVTAAPTAEMTGPVPLARTKWFKDVSGAITVGHGGVAPRGYRCVEAAELVRYLLALLQLPTAVEWVRQSMNTPTPNSLRVLLRALEDQSFVPSNEVEATSPSLLPSSSATALECGGATDTLFSATALLLLSLARHALLSVHAAHMRRQDSLRRRPYLHSPGASRSSRSWLPREESAATLQWRCSTLLDAVTCLNRLLEVSQTGPRMQPHRTAVNTWQFTAAQLLPLLRLAVQADLHAVQAVLLDHIRGVVFYLDDVGGVPARHKPLSHQADAVDDTVASRHWLPHAFRQSGLAAHKASLCSTDPAAQKGHSTQAAAEAAAPASSASADAAPAFSLLPSSSGTAVLDDLQRAPPAILSNKSLYAIMGEVVERVLSHCGAAESPASEVDATHADADAAAASRSRREEEDTLALWLHFYSDIMPYLYRDLVPSAEMAVDVLLCALELSPGARAGDDAALPAHSFSSSASAQAICYATLIDVAQFLCNLARVADDENYVLAMRKKESMSWIASTFTQEDPVAQAKRATLWDRSPVLSPIRGALPRLVTAATRCMRACDAAASEAGKINQSAVYAMWAADTDTDEALGWGAATAATAELLPSTGSETHLREQARRLLCLLNHAAGPEFLTAFLHDWCAQYALSSTWWLFEDKQQRERRVSLEAARHIETECASDVVAPRKGGGDTGVIASGEDEWVAAWRMKREAQQAACLLLADIGVSVSEVTAALTPLLRTAIKEEPHAEPLQPEQAPAFTGKGVSGAAASALAPLAPRPSSAAEMLFFLDQVVEGHCAERQGGLSDKDAEAVLAVVADAVSQFSPDTLAFCCLFHLLYCVVAYAKDEGAEGLGGAEVRKARRLGVGVGRRRQPKAFGTTTAAPATVSGVYRNGHFSFALCRLLEGFRVQPVSAQCTGSLLSLQLLCQTLRSVLPSSLAMVDNAGRVVDAATHVLQRALLPVLRHGIASASEAEIVLCAPLVCASLRVLRALVAGFAPDLTFERRAQRDTVSLLFSEHFFRYSRSSLHEWALLLRQWGSLDQGIHSLICERMVPSPGRLSAMMMSRETEALLWERSLRTLGFYTYAMHISEPPPAMVGAAATTGGSVGASAATPSVPLARHAEFVRLLREQLTYAFQHFSSSAIPTVAQLQQKEVFLQPVRAALFVFRVVLLCNVRESLVASLWPIVLPELFRVLSIQLTEKGPNTGKGAGSLSQPSSADVGVLREIAATQMEALKVLDMDYTLYPAHAFAFRWLFTDDTALESLAAMQARGTAGLQGGLPCSNVATRQPAVSHLEVLRLLQTSPQTVAEHLDAATVVNAVHEPRVSAAASHRDFCLAAPLSSIPRTWPTLPRPSAADTGLRRPLYNIPSIHYQRLDGVYRAAQAFTLLLQRLNMHTPHTSEAARSGQQNAATLASLCVAVSAAVGTHNEVDMAYIYDLLEADMTSTDPDTML